MSTEQTFILIRREDSQVLFSSDENSYHGPDRLRPGIPTVIACSFLSFILIGVLSFLDRPLAADAAKPPNVLFISIDDLNDWVGCYGGHPQIETPNIDALGRRGVTFTNAHCQAPICNPSRVSLTLGLLPSTTGIYFLKPGFREAESTRTAETVFQYFRQHGYYVTTCGKIFHGKPDVASFDHIEPADGWRRGKTKLRYTVPRSNPLWDWGEVEIPDSQQRDMRAALWAVDELPKLAKKPKPFFVALGFHLPHVPLYASKKWFEMYPLEQVQLPKVLQSDRDDLSSYAQQLTHNSVAPRHDWMVDNDEWRHAVRAYLATTSFVDHLVGQVLDSLKRSGVEEETIIVLWSDHGFHLGEKLRWAKRTLWEESTRVPLIIAGPGVQTDAVCSRPVGLIDLYPTLSDICNLPLKPDLEGVSLKPLLKDAGKAWDRMSVTTFGKNNHSIRSEHWRYIVYDDGSEELYDHRIDPHEWRNVAGNRELADIITRHRCWLPQTNVDAVPGSAGADSPLYDEQP